MDKIYNNFYNSIIYQDRYLFILNGLKNTILMAILAITIGIILGMIISIIRNYHTKTKKLKILNLICRLYVNIIRGTPVLLQLMIIYYIVFKSSDLSIVLIGALAFGLNSAAYTSEIIRAGIDSIDKGQEEAGITLGLNYSKVMRFILIPQAIRNIFPALGNEFITLIKETAVASAIGILDLTKAGDIIASRTYDYFFPLIIVAIIYLFITYSLSRLLSYIERRIDKYA